MHREGRVKHRYYSMQACYHACYQACYQCGDTCEPEALNGVGEGVRPEGAGAAESVHKVGSLPARGSWRRVRGLVGSEAILVETHAKGRTTGVDTTVERSAVKTSWRCWKRALWRRSTTHTHCIEQA